MARDHRSSQCCLYTSTGGREKEEGGVGFSWSPRKVDLDFSLLVDLS